MAEKNVFRSMMLFAGMLTMGMILTAFFAGPIIKVDQATKDSYKLVMGSEVGVDTYHENHLTVFEAMMFGIEGKSRGNVRHY